MLSSHAKVSYFDIHLKLPGQAHALQRPQRQTPPPPPPPRPLSLPHLFFPESQW